MERKNIKPLTRTISIIEIVLLKEYEKKLKEK